MNRTEKFQEIYKKVQAGEGTAVRFCKEFHIKPHNYYGWVSHHINKKGRAKPKRAYKKSKPAPQHQTIHVTHGAQGQIVFIRCPENQLQTLLEVANASK